MGQYISNSCRSSLTDELNFYTQWQLRFYDNCKKYLSHAKWGSRIIKSMRNLKNKIDFNKDYQQMQIVSKDHSKLNSFQRHYNSLFTHYTDHNYHRLSQTQNIPFYNEFEEKNYFSKFDHTDIPRENNLEFRQKLVLLKKHLDHPDHEIGTLIRKFSKLFVKFHSKEQISQNTFQMMIQEFLIFAHIIQESFDLYYDIYLTKNSYMNANDIKIFIISEMYSPEINKLFLNSLQKLHQIDLILLNHKFQTIDTCRNTIAVEFQLNQKTLNFLETENNKYLNTVQNENFYDKEYHSKRSASAAYEIFGKSYDIDMNINYYQQAQEELDQIQYQQDPFSKFAQILKTAQQIVICIKQFYSQYGYCQTRNINSDDVLDIFIHLVQLNKNTKLYLELNLLDRFLSNQIDSHITGFYFTTLKASFDYIMKQ